MAITESRIRQIIQEETRKVLREGVYDKDIAAAGGDHRPVSHRGEKYGRFPDAPDRERAGQGQNIDFLVAMVDTFGPELDMGKLRRALCRFRGVDPRNRGQYAGYFYGPNSRRVVEPYIDLRTMTLTSRGEDRLADQFGGQSIPSKEEMTEELEGYLD